MLSRIFAVIAVLIPLAPLAAQPAKTGADIVPSTAFGFVTIRVADLKNVESFKAVHEAIARLEKAGASIEKELGVPVDEIERLTLFWPAVPTSDHSMAPYIVVTTKSPYNEAKVLRALQALPPNAARRGLHGDPDAAHKAIAPPPAKAADSIPIPGSGLKGPADPFPPKGNPGLPKAFRGEGAQVGDPPPKVPARIEPAGDDTPGDGPDLYFRDRRPYRALFLLDNRTILHMPVADFAPESVYSFLGQLLRRKADGPLADALAETGKHTIVAAVRVPPIEEMIRRENDFPRELVPFRSLLKAKTVVVTADVDNKAIVTAKLTFADAATARRAEPVLKTLIQHGVDALADLRKEVARDAERGAVMTPLIDLVSAALDKADVKSDGTFVVARAEAEIGPAIAKSMAALPELIDIASAKTKTMNNLKQIGLACHNFHDTFGYMPANIVGPDGKVLFSWRVAILPFIEQDNMYRALDMTKPWDDPKNAKILATMPEVFRIYGRDAEKGKTFFQMPMSPQVVPGGSPILVPGRRATFANITDGTSNSIMVVEAASAVSWAKPDDLLFEAAKAPKVGSQDRKWFYTLFGDGSVRTLRRDKMTDDQIRAAMTIDGGEVVEIPDR